jgi:hypothetical protein
MTRVASVGDPASSNPLRCGFDSLAAGTRSCATRAVFEAAYDAAPIVPTEKSRRACPGLPSKSLLVLVETISISLERFVQTHHAALRPRPEAQGSRPHSGAPTIRKTQSTAAALLIQRARIFWFSVVWGISEGCLLSPSNLRSLLCIVARSGQDARPAFPTTRAMTSLLHRCQPQ